MDSKEDVRLTERIGLVVSPSGRRKLLDLRMQGALLEGKGKMPSESEVLRCLIDEAHAKLKAK